MASLLIHLPPIPFLQHLILLLILIRIPPYLSFNNDYKGCTNLINCGGVTNIGFPFWGENRPRECGHPLMQITCQNDISYITIKDVKYQVLDAKPDEHTLRITRVDYLQEGLCSSKHINTNLDTELFVYDPDYKNLTLFYGCAPSYSWPPTNGFPCPPNKPYSYGEYVYPEFGSPPYMVCKESVVVPVPPSLIDINDATEILKAIKDGFVVRWIAGVKECERCIIKSGGVCGIDRYSNQTTCYCRDGPCSNFSPDDAKTPPQSPPPGTSSV